MKVKLDENLGVSVANLFIHAEIDVETVRSEGLSGANDQQIISVCKLEQRCLVTLDLDFSN
jgi:predicted nuclease of predicted toxin-antitoxin system